jgi:hypothetical protein
MADYLSAGYFFCLGEGNSTPYPLTNSWTVAFILLAVLLA